MVRTRGAKLPWLIALMGFAAIWLSTSDAAAYPWLIRHNYSSCAACHVDPSGSGTLTAYGRAIGDFTLRARSDEASGDVPPSAGFLFGAVKTPEWLELGGDLRLMWLRTKANQAPLVDRVIWMQADLEATIDVSNFVASGSIGYAHEGALGAAITRRTEHNVVSRQHWLGYRFGGPAELLLRAGRMNLPFGIRSVEHNLWVRELTRTSINDDQQHGLALAFAVDTLRGELMAIGGNLQLRPDQYRERGYSAYVEWAPEPTLALGLSSLLTHRELDTLTLEETWRQAHGASLRWATPWKPLVVLTEWDYVFQSSRDQLHRRGLVTYTQLDLEPAQGVHFLITGEANDVGLRDQGMSWGGWLSYAWFFAPHADLRVDGIYQSLSTGPTRYGAYTLLLQGHLYL